MLSLSTKTLAGFRQHRASSGYAVTTLLHLLGLEVGEHRALPAALHFAPISLSRVDHAWPQWKELITDHSLLTAAGSCSENKNWNYGLIEAVAMMDHLPKIAEPGTWGCGEHIPACGVPVFRMEQSGPCLASDGRWSKPSVSDQLKVPGRLSSVWVPATGIGCR